MNTHDINRILGRNASTKASFIGCYASNQIPKTIYWFPHCMVVNIDPDWLKGSHWIAIYCRSPHIVEYFDPLGIWPPASVHIRDYLSHFNQIHFNADLLQSPHSNTCGKHVIYYIYHRCMGIGLREIIEKFRREKAQKNALPDEIVNRFFRYEIFNKI